MDELRMMKLDAPDVVKDEGCEMCLYVVCVPGAQLCCSLHGSPPDRREWRSSSHHSVGLAGINLSEVSELVWRREIIQRMK